MVGNPLPLKRNTCKVVMCLYMNQAMNAGVYWREVRGRATQTHLTTESASLEIANPVNPE